MRLLAADLSKILSLSRLFTNSTNVCRRSSWFHNFECLHRIMNLYLQSKLIKTTSRCDSQLCHQM